jgi:siroheme synthase (precorrin-2 oxidase/ferrochelatase)
LLTAGSIVFSCCYESQPTSVRDETALQRRLRVKEYKNSFLLIAETNEKAEKRELIQAASEKAQLVVIFKRNFPKIGFENLAITAVLLGQL